MKVKKVLMIGAGIGVVGLLAYAGYKYRLKLKPTFRVRQDLRTVNVTWCGQQFAFKAGQGSAMASCGLYDLKLSERAGAPPGPEAPQGRVYVDVQLVNRITGQGSAVPFTNSI